MKGVVMQAGTTNFRKIGMLIAGAAIIASCTVSVEENGPGYPGSDRPQFCTREFAPVCGVRGSVRQTFGNACEARSRSFRIISSGECSYQGNSPGGGWSGRPDRPAEPSVPSMCTQQYEPVCGRRGDSIQSFGNACEARSAGYQVIGRGRC